VSEKLGEFTFEQEMYDKIFHFKTKLEREWDFSILGNIRFYFGVAPYFSYT
jgi:hypothetical protein